MAEVTAGMVEAGVPVSPRHDVFISYSHKNKAQADAVCALLERDGVRCWIAPRDAEAGAEWATSIIRAIHSARAFVLIFSEPSNTSSRSARRYRLRSAVNCRSFRSVSRT